MVSSVAQVRPAQLACTECRAKHLKCDGGTPRCGRCDLEGLHCVYTPSRRGYGRRNANRRDVDPSRGQQTPAASPQSTNITQFPADSLHTPANSATSNANEVASTSEPNRRAIAPVQLETPQSAFGPAPSTPAHSLQNIDRELLIKSYYAHFHPAHPLLAPRSFFSRREYPEYLQWMVYFVGQQYVAQYSGILHIDNEVTRMLDSEKDEITICRLQALVIYAIALHSLNRPQEALECVRRATQIANALGLSRSDFASSNAALGSVEEESIRRTWWELYTIEAYLSALHRRVSLLSNEQGPYPTLPSYETSYNAGICDMNPPSLTLFENRAFARGHERSKFSTYCYRIEATRIIRRVIDLFSSEEKQSDAVQAVDTAVASWKYYLPDASDIGSEDSGEIDPLLFQAQFLIHSASILLHFPRSDLPATVPSAADIACVRSHAQRIPGSLRHSTKAITASKEITNLAASLSSTNGCSPLFICALILACIVQLAASTFHLGARSDTYVSHYRDRVVLLLGVLTEMGRRWTVARNALQPLRIVADTIFGTPREDTAMMPSPAETYNDIGNANDGLAGVPWFDLFSIDELMADFMASTSETNNQVQSSDL